MIKSKINYLMLLLIVLVIMLFIIFSGNIEKVSEISFSEILTPNILENIGN